MIPVILSVKKIKQFFTKSGDEKEEEVEEEEKSKDAL